MVSEIEDLGGADLLLKSVFCFVVLGVCAAQPVQAQTCVGTANVVCTNETATGVFANTVTDGPTLTLINTATGSASSIQAQVDSQGTVINNGSVAGNITTRKGYFGSITQELGNATTINTGHVGGRITTFSATFDYGGDAISNNSGYVGSVIQTLTYNSLYGDAIAVNSGYARFIRTDANTFLGSASSFNSGQTLLIFTSSFSNNATSENTGVVTGGIGTTAGGAGFAKTINSGTVTSGISSRSSDGPASIWNSGLIGHDGTGGAASASATSDRGTASIVNSGTILGTDNGAVAAKSATGAASVVNSGAIFGTVTVQSGYNGTAGPGSFLTNSGLIDGTGRYAAIDLTVDAPDARMTLNLLPGSRVIGRIFLAGIPSDPNALLTTVNVQGSGRGISSILTFGDSDGSGLIEAGGKINVTNAIYVISGNSIAIVDPSTFAVANRNMVDVTHAIGSLVAGRLGSDAPATSEGQAFGFAPSGNIARDMANDAFASMPGIAYAAHDRVLSGNPTFTTTDGIGIWAQGFGGRRVAPEDGPTLRSINSFFGGAVGIDKAVQPNLRLGAFFGGGNVQSNLDASAGRTVSDIGFAGLYGRYTLNGSFLDFSLLGGGTSNATDRKIDNNLAAGGTEYAKGNYVGSFISPELTYGIVLPLGTNTTLTPSVRIRYLAAGFGGYQEGGSAANLTVASRLAHYIEERGGVALKQTLADVMHGRLQLTGAVGISALQRAGDSDVNAVLLGQSLAFVTPGAGNVTGVYVSAGFDWRHSSGASVFATTEFNSMSDASRTITARGGLKATF